MEGCTNRIRDRKQEERGWREKWEMGEREGGRASIASESLLVQSNDISK